MWLTKLILRLTQFDFRLTQFDLRLIQFDLWLTQFDLWLIKFVFWPQNDCLEARQGGKNAVKFFILRQLGEKTARRGQKKGNLMVEIKDGFIVPPSEPVKLDIAKQTLMFKNGAKGFYVIAGLSLLNTILSISQANIRFFVGLGITQVIDAITILASEDYPAASTIFKIISVILNTIFAGIIALFGWLALQKKAWAFIVGMILFSLDSILSLLFRDWISLGFHVLVLIYVFKGLIALKNIKKAENKII